MAGLADGAWPDWLMVLSWALLSGAVSMTLYAKLSPQVALQALKAEQKASRQALLRHEGSVPELYRMIGKDLILSLKQLAKIFIPVAISILPVIYIISCLFETYQGEIVSFGPEWFRGVEAIYLLALLTVSLIIKIKFRII
jgi:hypothetical protein